MSSFRKFTPDEDAPLLLSWHRGDLSAFENLVWKYLKRVFSLAFYLTGSEESAAAATQNAFVAAFVNISSFSSRFHFSDWLLAFTLKEARELLDYKDSLLTETAGDRSDMLEHLVEQLRQLPPELAEVIVLHDVRGYSLERISEIYQLRAEIPAARLFAAHEMLAALLRKKSSPVNGEEKIVPHPEIRLSFHAYLDSSLSGEDADEIRKHLKTCGSCREALTGLEWIVEHLKQLPDIDPPHWLTAAIMQRVKSPPVKKMKVRKTRSMFYLLLGAGILFISIIGLSAYLLLPGHENLPQVVTGKEAEQKPAPSPLQSRQQPKAVDFIPTFTTPFRTPDKPAATAGRAAVPTVPLPLSATPVETTSAPLPSPAGSPAAATTKNETFGRRNKIERAPELPSEWVDSPPPARSQPKKAAPVRSRSSELTVEMVTKDPLAAIQDVENAVAASGGEITGRAYSSGSDILYTRLPVDRVFDLLSRLGKTGRIQELPQLPAEAEGTVDLIIKWH